MMLCIVIFAFVVVGIFEFVSSGNFSIDIDVVVGIGVIAIDDVDDDVIGCDGVDGVDEVDDDCGDDDDGGD